MFATALASRPAPPLRTASAAFAPLAYSPSLIGRGATLKAEYGQRHPL
jgi:hypothetical protein